MLDARLKIKLDERLARFHELEAKLADPEIGANPNIGDIMREVCQACNNSLAAEHECGIEDASHSWSAQRTLHATRCSARRTPCAGVFGGNGVECMGDFQVENAGCRPCRSG